MDTTEWHILSILCNVFKAQINDLVMTM